MKLFKIEILDYSNSQQESIIHKVFLDDKEELTYRRSMDNQVKQQIIRNYKMIELNVENINDISTLTSNMSLSDFQKLLLFNTNQSIAKDNTQPFALHQLSKINQDEVICWCGGMRFTFLNELITKYNVNNIYLSPSCFTEICDSIDVNSNINQLLTRLVTSSSTLNEDIIELWYSVNCGFNFKNQCYYAYNIKIPFNIDENLPNKSLIGLHDNNIVVIHNIEKEYFKN
ncbi:hypothetical protein [Clostridium botulinum]|uniref:hypothetical protein n=1 Tax=Clostridium botulinum TaxID=1491 RepID=UPI00069BD80C|nr:hypothetical protein [Clostridium botulinum]KOA77340.1 hypothetical protein ADU78_03890 [Clostridium botulinum]KOA90632.1 hypothetical protein ADU76_13200 [Clostridium botulinum]KOC34947.1 hypothetical protein ADU81_04870 [Clostridium botulinum]MCD3202494.1 hypothetical protein [Clostridium botulinum C/D]MCD3223576.1 hypothetical protein [Clostridium botulinum C/D]